MFIAAREFRRRAVSKRVVRNRINEQIKGELMRNMTAVSLATLILLALLSGCTGDPQFAKYTSNSQCVLVGISPNRLLVYHIPSGRTLGCEKCIHCEDAAGTRLLIPIGEGRCALLQLRSDGKITRRICRWFRERMPIPRPSRLDQVRTRLPPVSVLLFSLQPVVFTA